MKLHIKCLTLILFGGGLFQPIQAQQPSDPNIVINPRLFEGLDYREVAQQLGREQDEGQGHVHQ